MSLYYTDKRSLFEAHFVKLNQHFNVFLEYTSSILQIYFKSTFQYFQKYPLQLYFTKKSWPLLEVHLSKWTTLWVECIVWKLQSHSQDLLSTNNPKGYLIFIRLTFEGRKAERIFKPPHGFEPGTSGMIYLHPNH